jgi:hypothetical protein
MNGQHHAPAALPTEKTKYPLYRRLVVKGQRYIFVASRSQQIGVGFML